MSWTYSAMVFHEIISRYETYHTCLAFNGITIFRQPYIYLFSNPDATMTCTDWVPLSTMYLMIINNYLLSNIHAKLIITNYSNIYKYVFYYMISIMINKNSIRRLCLNPFNLLWNCDWGEVLMDWSWFDQVLV